jgi:hypothetical protein
MENGHQSPDLRRQRAYQSRKRLGISILPAPVNLNRFVRALKAEGRVGLDDNPSRGDLGEAIGAIIQLYCDDWTGKEDRADPPDID